MAGCMLFVFAALGEFVVVKVFDLQYQIEVNVQNLPKCLTAVSNLSILKIHQETFSKFVNN